MIGDIAGLVWGVMDADDAVLDLDTDTVDERDEWDEQNEYCEDAESSAERLFSLDSGCLPSFDWLRLWERLRLQERDLLPRWRGLVLPPHSRVCDG